MFERYPLTLKMLVITFLTASLAYLALDYFQTRKLRTVLYDQLQERLKTQALEDRMRFNRYVDAHNQAAKLIVSQKRFMDYTAKNGFSSASKIRFHDEVPLWLPKPTVLRAFVHIKYALLLDGSGRVREVFMNTPQTPPPTILLPTDLMRKLSHSQSLMTEIDGFPYLVTSESAFDQSGKTIAALMLASPIDEDFLMSAMGTVGADHLVALLEEDPYRVVVSNNSQALPRGALIEAIKEKYIITGKSFFDQGSSELLLQFVSFISTAEAEMLTKSTIAAARKNSAVTAFALIFVFALVVCWITENVKGITEGISTFSKDVLGIQPKAVQKGDELYTLKTQFNALTDEIIEARENLQREAEERLHLAVKAKEAEAAEFEVNMLRAVTEVLGIGIISCSSECSPDNLAAMNRLMEEFAESCGGVQNFYFGGDEVYKEITLPDNEGGRRAFLIHKPFVPGEIKFILVSDITEKRKIESSLEEKTIYLDSILRSAPVAVAATDLDFRIKYYNPLAEDIFGYKAKDVLGRTVQEIHTKEKVEASRFDRAIERVRDTGEYKYIVEQKKGDGSRFIESRVSGIYDYQDRLVGFVLMSADITDQKNSEYALKKYSEDLERSNKELEQFAYIASHDLQEPLRTVAGFTQLIGRRYKGRLGADADEFIPYILEGVNRMQNMIQDLLAYSRVGTEARPFETTDCGEAVKTAVSNLKAAIDDSGAEVAYDRLPVLKADGAQLVQLFQNLIGNAIKYRGGEPLKIQISSVRENGLWKFSVRDNGIGFEPKYAEKIFKIFQRLHGKGEYEGTGIGLAVCKKIVERHGGGIWAESEPGKGATFYFTLPAARE
jgi:PAS domain S-box-containing protein